MSTKKYNETKITKIVKLKLCTAKLKTSKSCFSNEAHYHFHSATNLYFLMHPKIIIILREDQVFPCKP